jgi:hypothetical protein
MATRRTGIVSNLEKRSPRDLIRDAEKRGTLSQRSSTALQRPAIVQQVQDALAGSYTLRTPGQSLLLTMMPDDSNSMKIKDKQGGVIDGHNELLGMMAVSSASKRMLLQTRYLNGFILNPFGPLTACKPLDRTNYPCIYGTPLYEQTLVTLGAVLAKDEELTAGGARVRTATLIMTDAESTDNLADALLREVASVVADMRRIGDHIVAGMCFPSGDESYCRAIFSGMGMEDRYIFSASSRREILEAFRLFGESALQLTS